MVQVVRMSRSGIHGLLAGISYILLIDLRNEIEAQQNECFYIVITPTKFYSFGSVFVSFETIHSSTDLRHEVHLGSEIALKLLRAAILSANANRSYFTLIDVSTAGTRILDRNTVHPAVGTVDVIRIRMVDHISSRASLLQEMDNFCLNGHVRSVFVCVAFCSRCFRKELGVGNRYRTTRQPPIFILIQRHQ